LVERAAEAKRQAALAKERAASPDADAATAASEAKKDMAPSTRVHTNNDLVGVSTPAAAASSEIKTAPTGASGPAAQPATNGVKNEDWWRSHALLLQRQRDADMRRLISARSHFAGLPDYARGILGVPVVDAWMKARADIARLEAVVATDVQAVEDFEEEARRSGIIPGWLREK
jgi:hypothetical protein